MYKKILVLFSGTMLAQLFPLLTMPILTRLFTPEEIGVYSLYLIVISLGVIISTLRFELAIPMISEKKISASIKNIIAINAIGAIIFSTVMLFLEYKNDFFTNYNYILIGVFIFISINFVGMYQIFYQYGIKNAEFKKLSTNKVINQINIAILSLIIGYLFNSYLIMALVIAQVLCILILIRSLRIKLDFYNISFRELKETIIMYKKFPLFQLPIQLFSTVSANSILLATSVLYSSTELGFYSLTERILRSPISILGSGSGDLFKNMAAKEMEQTGHCLNSYKKIMVFNLVTGIPIFVVLYLVIDIAILHLFGEQWMRSAEYSKILIPSLFAMYLVFPVNYLFIIYDLQKIEIVMQIIQFCAITIGVIWVMNNELIINDLLLIYTFISTVFSFVIGILGFLIIKFKRRS